jgi:hypothetical protein
VATPPARIFRGAKGPEALEVTIATGDSGIVMTTVTAVTLVRVDATATDWTTDLSNTTVSSLKATHIFASDGSDVPIPARYQFIAHLSTPGGMRRAGPFTLTIT